MGILGVGVAGDGEQGQEQKENSKETGVGLVSASPVRGPVSFLSLSFSQL